MQACPFKIKSLIILFLTLGAEFNITAQNLVVGKVSGPTIEDGTSASFTVGLDAAATEGITVTIVSQNTSEVTVNPATVNFALNESGSFTITLTGVDDDIVDGNQEVIIDITPSIGTATQVTVTNNDDDISELSITATTQAAEDNTNGLFTISASNPVSSNITIRFAVEGTATSGADYTPLVSPVTLATNTTSVNLPVLVTGDHIYEGNETVTVNLNAYTNNEDVYAGEMNSATITISDNDIPGFILSASTLDITEGQSSSFSVVLATQPDTPVTLNLTNNNPDAAIHSPSNLTFNPSNWNTAQTVNIEAIQDNNLSAEIADISVNADPTSDISYRNLPAKKLIVNIYDDDTAPVFTSTPTTTIDEDALYHYPIVTSDSDGDIAVLTALLIPSWLSFRDNGNGTGVLIGTPRNDDVANSPYNIVIRATDRLTSVDHSFSITVINTNDAPIFATPSITVATEDSPYVYDIQIEDDDKDPIVITAQIIPDWLTLIDHENEQASLNGTPLNEDVGEHTVILSANDGTTSTNQEFTISVTNTNDAPVVTSVHIINAIEDSEYNYHITTNDDDGDAVTISASSLPVWLTLTDNNDGTALLQGTPLQQHVGLNPVLLRISDNQVTQYIGFEIEVSNINDAPIIIENTIPFTTAENIMLSIPIADIAFDEDGNINISSLQVIDQPNHGTVIIDYSNETVNYTPTQHYSGTDLFTLQVEDLSGAESNIGTINISISNEAPNAVNDNFTIDEDTPSTLNVLNNDNDLQNNIVASSVAIITNPLNGTTMPQTDGSILYTPTNNYYGKDHFTYSINDEDGYSDHAIVTININSVNDAPTLEDDETSVMEDNSVTINVLENDSDIDDELVPSSLQIVDQVNHGSLIINNANHNITYTPEPNYNGTDTFSYSVEDESGARSEASVSITIIPVNDWPVAVDDYVQTQEETAIIIRLLDNDSDLENNIDSCSVSIQTQAQHGTVSTDGFCGRVRYTPEANYNGEDSFTYQVCDSVGACNTATVHISIDDVPDAPIAVADNYTTDEDTPLLMDILANDTDNDNNIDISSISISSAASHGSLEIIDGQILYTPNANFNGSDNFEYQVCDATSLCATAPVSVTITPVNDAPVAEDDTETIIVNYSAQTNVTDNDTDVDNNLDLSSISIITPPQHGEWQVEEGTGIIIYTPQSDFEGQDEYIYRICDTDGLCDEATVYLTVSTNNSKPQTNSDQIETDEDEPVNIMPLANDTDPEDNLDPSTLTIIEGPFNGEYILEHDTIIVYTPHPDYFGNDTIIYHVCDSGLPSFCAVDSIFITINPINDAPVANEDFMTVIEGQSGELDLAFNDTDVESPKELLTVRISDHTPIIKGTAIILDDQRTLRFTAAYDCGCNEEEVHYILEDGTNAIAKGKVTIYIKTAPDNFPEVFTPNEDGVNDKFIIPGIKNGEFDDNNELIVFNRWGAQVYSMKNYDNSWDGKSSAGTLGNEDLAEGTYFYVFKMDDGTTYKGTVYLKR